MELRRYGTLLLSWWWLLVGCTAAAAISAYFVSRAQPPVYNATTTLLINQLSTPGTLTYSDALLNEQLGKTYSQMIVQPLVLGEVIKRLNLGIDETQLGRLVSAQPVVETQLLAVSVEGNDPAFVRDVANTAAAVFIEQQRPFLPKDQVDSAIRIAQPALLPAYPVGPRVGLNTALAAAVGLLLGIAVAAAFEYLDDTVKSPERLEEATSLVALGSIMRLANNQTEPLSLVDDTHVQGPAAEAYRLVRMSIDFASVDHSYRTLVVTSAGPGDGKTTTAVNLAAVFGQDGKQVIVVDTDLHRPSLHRAFGIPNERGLTNLLVGDLASIEGYLQPTLVRNVRVLTSGPRPRGPAQLLASERMTQVIERLKGMADLVIFDSPPVLAVADPAIVAGKVDGTILVVDAERTRTDAVRRVKEVLSRSGSRILGVVLNRIGRRDGYYEYYGTYTRDAVSSNGVAHTPGLLGSLRRRFVGDNHTRQPRATLEQTVRLGNQDGKQPEE